MAIQLKGITKTFHHISWRNIFNRKKPQKINALQDISLSVGSGEVYGLLGSNGAGKTTLIKILATLVLPDKGDASICGFDLYKQPRQVRQVIGLVNSSERSFYWRLTGKQNLSFFAALWNLSKQAGNRRVDELLKLVGLKEKADDLFMTYSTGQQQRLAVARALLSDPKILFMDEATRSLDPLAAAKLCSFVKNKLAEKHGKTIVWCTHNLQEAEKMCLNLAILHKGRILTSGSMDKMQSLIDKKSFYRLKVKHWPDKASAKISVLPVHVSQNNGYVELRLQSNENHIPILLKELINSGIEIYSCSREKIPLEEIFQKRLADSG